MPLNYGKVVSLALDPIEKKALRRFHAGSKILSLGSFGCNMSCPFCQNYEISMAENGELPTRDILPEELAELAEELIPRGNIGAAYTYNEPLIGYEYVRDCARRLRERNMLNVVVSNGMLAERPWRELLPLIDAANIDLKGFTDSWYRCLGGDLETAKRSIALAAKVCHVEVTTLLIPGENDSEEEIRALSGWLSSLNPEIPLHLTRFFPRYRMTDRPATSVDAVYRLTEIARESLRWVYPGNC